MAKKQADIYLKKRKFSLPNGIFGQQSDHFAEPSFGLVVVSKMGSDPEAVEGHLI